MKKQKRGPKRGKSKRAAPCAHASEKLGLYDLEALHNDHKTALRRVGRLRRLESRRNRARKLDRTANVYICLDFDGDLEVNPANATGETGGGTSGGGHEVHRLHEVEAAKFGNLRLVAADGQGNDRGRKKLLHGFDFGERRRGGAEPENAETKTGCAERHSRTDLLRFLQVGELGRVFVRVVGRAEREKRVNSIGADIFAAPNTGHVHLTASTERIDHGGRGCNRTCNRHSVSFLFGC